MLRVGPEHGHAGTQPGGGDTFRLEQRHAARPLTAPAMSPEGPRDFRQLGMTRFGAEIDKALLKRCGGTVPRIAPHLTVGLVRLLVGRRQERAVMLACECLPVQVVRARQSRLARALATAVLMHDDAPQRLRALG